MSDQALSVADMAEELDPMDILEGIDPDWRDHFFDPWDAVDYYKKWSYENYVTAVKEAFQ